jgi:hypothetical protein
MPEFRYTPNTPWRYPVVPLVWTNYTPDDIQDWLVNQGVPATNVRSEDAEDGKVTYIVTSDVDPATVLQGTRPPRRHEQARQYLNANKQLFIDRNATNDQAQRAIAALITLLGI